MYLGSNLVQCDLIKAADIETPLKQRATLLHFGGSGLQDIYYNLTGANADPSEDIDVFEIALQKLDEDFLPKQSRVHERHTFRLIKQEENEKFEKLLVRLRNQADKCKFGNPEKHLIDQITEKCSPVELRKKIVTVGDDITLKKIIMEANTLEVENHQLEEYGSKRKFQEVNEVSTSGRRDRKIDFSYNKESGRKSQCSRTNKLSSNYNPTPHTVEARRDGVVMLKNDEIGRRCRRNIIHLEKIEGQWKPVNQDENQEQGQEDDMQE
nr:unnamed protein product [Callosobruchus analis]